MINRLVFTLLLAALMTPVSASAATPYSVQVRASGSHSLRSKALGIAFRYPANWKVVNQAPAGNAQAQVTVAAPLPSHDALTAQIVGIKAAASLRTTLKRFVTYQSGMGNTTFAHAAWHSVSLGKSSAMATVVVPSTEGGASVSQAIYVTQSRSRVYQVTLFSIHTPARSRLSQFLPVYGKILATWRFL